MRFTPLPLADAWLIEIEPIVDERGFFARTYCRDEFVAHGLKPELVQCNISHNRKAGTLRGMHYQKTPSAETKLVRCTRGAIYDVIIDLREDSPTYQQWHGVELTCESRSALYVPEGFAHGFLTMTDDVEVFYQMTEFYHADHASGVRYDDPALGIVWPGPVVVISERDANYPDLQEVLR